MSLESSIVRLIIRWLWSMLLLMKGRYPFQFRDISQDIEMHVAYNPGKKPKEEEPATTTKYVVTDMVGQTHTARMAGGGE